MKKSLSILLFAASAFSQDYQLPISSYLDSLSEGFFASIKASPTNETPVIALTTNGVVVFSVFIRSEVVTNWIKLDDVYIDQSLHLINRDGFFYQEPKLRDFSMVGTIVSNVIAWVTWKGKTNPVVVESTPLGTITKHVTHESKEVETVGPVTWYGTNVPTYWLSITNRFINGSTIGRLTDGSPTE